jgi:hypothetical protein
VSGIVWASIYVRNNISVVLNTTVPSSVLKKKYHAITNHQVRETIAARIMSFSYIKGEEKCQ